MKLIPLVISLSLWVGFANADQYSQFTTPDAIKCHAIVKDVCTDNSRPDKMVVQYQDRSTGALSMQEESTVELVYCRPRKDKCFDDAGAYRGKSVNKVDSRYVLFKDYYVYPGPDGTDWAFKNGTGPLFGGVVKVNNVAPTAISKNGTYDVWCNPVGDTCNITTTVGDLEVTRDKLPTYMAVAKGGLYCSLEFCYDNNNDIIGLNPDYTF